MVKEKGGRIRELAERCKSIQRQVSEGAAMAELESYRLVAKDRDKWEARETRLEQQLDKLWRRLDRRRSSRSSSEHHSHQSYSSSSESEREDSGSRYVGSCTEPSLGQDKVVSSTSMACLMSDPRGRACSNQPLFVNSCIGSTPVVAGTSSGVGLMCSTVATSTSACMSVNTNVSGALPVGISCVPSIGVSGVSSIGVSGVSDMCLLVRVQRMVLAGLRHVVSRWRIVLSLSCLGLCWPSRCLLCLSLVVP